MRKRTLAGACALLALTILIALRFSGLPVPLGLAPFFVYLLLVPLLMIPMTLLNKRLLAWRKARGRDIENEERYEIEEVDMISLRPRPDNLPASTDEELHLRILFR